MPLYTYKCRICLRTRDLFRPMAEHNNYPVCCGQATYQVISPPHVMPDIKPYHAVAADKETGKAPQIGSRSAHKNFLKRNGYEELGNDAPRPSKPDKTDAIATDIAKEIAYKWRGG